MHLKTIYNTNARLMPSRKSKAANTRNFPPHYLLLSGVLACSQIGLLVSSRWGRRTNRDELLSVLSLRYIQFHITGPLWRGECLTASGGGLEIPRHNTSCRRENRLIPSLTECKHFTAESTFDIALYLDDSLSLSLSKWYLNIHKELLAAELVRRYGRVEL